MLGRHRPFWPGFYPTEAPRHAPAPRVAPPPPPSAVRVPIAAPPRYAEAPAARAPSAPPPPPPPSTPRAVSADPAPAPEANDREALRRALADLAAAEGRVEKNAERVYTETRGALVSELLPVLDNLDRTIRASENAADETLLAGVRMVRTSLEGVLLRFGLEPIAARGEMFDPSVHEAVMGVPIADRSRQGRVVDEVAPGYRFGGRVLRASKVTVGVEPEAQGADAVQAAAI